MFSRMAIYHTLLLFFVVLLSSVVSEGNYTPDWKSLDGRPLPEWYDDVKIGIFIHWGVFSVPSYGAYKHAAEWFWTYWNSSKEFKDYMTANYPPNFQYPDFATSFHADLFDPNAWADLFKKSGAGYVVLTAKHHEGYCNWPSQLSFNWNSMSVGPGSDLVGRLAAAVRSRTKMKFGLYHSMYEWFHPLYLLDKKNHFTTNYFVKSKTGPELYELVEKYKPEVIWSDGDWEAPDSYWNSTNFLAWLYNDSPVRDTVVTNDRWGSGDACHHGGYYTCQDRYNPGKLLNHKWENCLTLDRYSWGFRREMMVQDVLTIENLLKQVITSVSCGGNVLINVGPTSSGTIAPIFEERLLQLGSWMTVNGEAIYGTRPWSHQNDTSSSRVWYTASKRNSKTVYAILLKYPTASDYSVTLSKLILKSPSQVKIELLGHGSIRFTASNKYTKVYLPNPSLLSSQMQWAWSLKIIGDTN